MMKGLQFLLMTSTTLIILSNSISSARELESAPLNPQDEQAKYCSLLELFSKGWSCWQDFVAKKNTVSCCTAIADSMANCPHDIIPNDWKQDVKNLCGEVIKNSGSNVALFGSVSNPVRLADLVKNTAVQAHNHNGEN